MVSGVTPPTAVNKYIYQEWVREGRKGHKGLEDNHFGMKPK